MAIKINYSNKISGNTTANLILFSDDKFKLNNLKKHISNSEFSYISDLLKISDLKKNLLVFDDPEELCLVEAYDLNIMVDVPKVRSRL